MRPHSCHPACINAVDAVPPAGHKICLAFTLVATASIFASLRLRPLGGSTPPHALWATQHPVLASDVRTTVGLAPPQAMRGPAAQLDPNVPATSLLAPRPKGAPPPHTWRSKLPLHVAHAVGCVTAVVGCCAMLLSLWRRVQAPEREPLLVALLSTSGTTSKQVATFPGFWGAVCVQTRGS